MRILKLNIEALFYDIEPGPQRKAVSINRLRCVFAIRFAAVVELTH